LLNEQLANSLRRTHNARRVHGLVGGNEHEARDALPERGTENIRGPRDIRQDCLLGEALHERDVLVRRSVEDHIGADFRDEPEQLRPLADIHDDRDDVRRIYVGPQTVQRLEDAVLAPPEEDQPAWPEGKRLARELAPDRAAGASDENAVAAERIRDRAEIDPNWRPAEEILDLDLSDRVHRDPPGDYLRDARHGQAPCAFRFGL